MFLLFFICSLAILLYDTSYFLFNVLGILLSIGVLDCIGHFNEDKFLHSNIKGRFDPTSKFGEIFWMLNSVLYLTELVTPIKICKNKIYWNGDFAVHPILLQLVQLHYLLLQKENQLQLFSSLEGKAFT